MLTDPVAVRTLLDRLCSQNLLDIRVTDDVRYRYRPGTGDLAAAADALLAAYRRDPLAVARLVTDRPHGVARLSSARDASPVVRLA